MKHTATLVLALAIAAPLMSASLASAAPAAPESNPSAAVITTDNDDATEKRRRWGRRLNSSYSGGYSGYY